MVAELAGGYLRLNWSAQPRTSADVPALLSAAARHLAELGYDRMLADQTTMLPFTADEQRWITAQWLPEAVASGYRFGAILVSANVLARLATAYITTSVQNLPLRYRSFDSEAAAVEWLLRQA